MAVRNAAPSPHRLALLALTGALAVGVAGCEQRESAEALGAKAGRAIDRAGEQARSAVDAAGDSIARAGETAREQAADAARAFDDGAVTARVKSKLVAEAGPAGMSIDVDTANGVVTLAGTVDAPDIRDRALRAAAGVDGVKSVRNRLVVAGGS